MCRGEDWCPSTPNQQSVLCVHMLLAPCVTQDSKQCVMCCFIHWYHRAKMAQLLIRIPTWEVPWTSDHSSATRTFTLSNPTVHTHFSVVTVVSQIHRFFNKQHAFLLWKLTHIKRNWAFSRAILPHRISEYQLPFSGRWLSTADESTMCNSWNENLWEPPLVTSALKNTPAVSEKSQLVPPSSEWIFFPFPWTKSL